MFHKCLSCKNDKFNNILNVKKFPIYWGVLDKQFITRVKYHPLRISQCISCGLVQQTKLLKKKVMDQIYETENYLCPSPVKSGMGKREILKFYDFFKKQKLYKKKILEIACYDCFLLKILKKQKHDVHGCDPSIDTIQQKKNFPKNKIRNIFYESGLYPKKSFDVIIFRNLLEHVEDLNFFLKSVKYSLRDNGSIFIDVPNMNEIYKIGGLGLFFHQHLSYFSYKSLKHLLINNGFEIKDYHEGKPNLFIHAVSKNKILENNKTNIKLVNKDLISNKFASKINKIHSIFKNKNNSNIALFGASALCTTIVTLLNNKELSKIKCVSDNDNFKVGKILCGSNYIVEEPKKLINKKLDKIIICSYFFVDEIIKSLTKLDIPRKKIVTLD